jgi:molybdate transport system permease protein
MALSQNRQTSLKISTLSGRLIVAAAFVFIVILLVIPLATLLWRTGPGWLTDRGQTPTVAAALQLSLFTATLTTLISMLAGTPVAYILARYRFWGITLLDTVIDLPMVLPPAVAGVALLVTFGRNGLVGQYLARLGIELPFTTAAVVIAQIFVAAPFYIRAAKSGFAGVDIHLEQISATLGESTLGTFRRVTLPLARKSLIGGAILTWTRALGEFGATILFAGNLAGRTQTMPLAIYTALQSNINTALTLASILLVASLALLILLRAITQ